jgi:protein SCO1
MLTRKYFQYFLVILTTVLLTACKNTTETEENTTAAEEELPEMSVFHLPSTWNTQHGKTIELIDLQGDVLVVVMIYTSCKAACPRLVADMRNIESKVSSKARNNVKYILVSIDPEEDTPERMLAFSRENKMTEDHWLFLQGTTNTVHEFANILAIKYKQISPIDFSHSNIISVFDRQGVLQHQMEGLEVNNDATVNKIIELSR